MSFLKKVELRDQLRKMGINIVEGNYVKKKDVEYYIIKITAGDLLDFSTFKEKKEKENEKKEKLKNKYLYNKDESDYEDESDYDDEDESDYDDDVAKEELNKDKECEKAAKALKDALAKKTIKNGKMTLKHKSIWATSKRKEGVSIFLKWVLGKHFVYEHYTAYYGGRDWADTTGKTVGKDQYQIIIPEANYHMKHHELGTNTETAAQQIMKMIGSNPFKNVQSYTDNEGKLFYVFWDQRISKYRVFIPSLVTENNKWHDGGMTKGFGTAKQALDSMKKTG